MTKTDNVNKIGGNGTPIFNNKLFKVYVISYVGHLGPNHTIPTRLTQVKVTRIIRSKMSRVVMLVEGDDSIADGV